MSSHLTIKNKVYSNCLVVVYGDNPNQYKAPLALINVQDDYRKFLRAVNDEIRGLEGLAIVTSWERSNQHKSRRVRCMYANCKKRKRELLIHSLRKQGFYVQSVEADSIDEFYEIAQAPERFRYGTRIVRI